MAKFKDFKDRLATFDNWPTNKPKPKALAEAGFYYTGERDVTTCYSCNFKLHGWDPQDDPWQEHEKTRNHCTHLQKHKDEEAKRSREQEKPSPGPSMSKQAMTDEDNKKKSSEMEELKKKIEELKEQSSDVRCKICLDEMVQLIFLPCKHFSVCAECGKDMNKCPICREWVVEQMKIYM